MRKLFVIGIGAGDPDQLTVQAVKAMNQVDVFFVIGKGLDKGGLAQLRAHILGEHMTRPYRIVEIPDPFRDRAPSDYRGVVDDWHRRRAELLAEQFERIDGVGAILVWGDPALYDSTLRIVERVLDEGSTTFDYEVVPGVTSVAALAARHRMVLHDVGDPVLITTGRRLRADGLLAASTVVMLDADCSFAALPGDIHIYWAAYLGLPDETRIDGRIADVAELIKETRAELRARNGWIMDIYLLRAPRTPKTPLGGPQPSSRHVSGVTRPGV